MSKRRAHSSIDKLPAELRRVLTKMIVDDLWPEDFTGDTEGKPKYEDLVFYCIAQGYSVSPSAIGRWAKNMRMLARMRSSAEIVRNVMKDVTAERATETQRAVAEMITAITVDFISDHENFKAKDIKEIARAIKDCTAVSLNADKYIRQQLGAKLEASAKSTKSKLTKAGVNRKLIQEIIDEHLGVIKS